MLLIAADRSLNGVPRPVHKDRPVQQVQLRRDGKGIAKSRGKSYKNQKIILKIATIRAKIITLRQKAVLM